MNPPRMKVPAAVYCMVMLLPPPASGTQEREYPVITPLRRVGAGGDQENVMFLALGVIMKLCGGPVGAKKKKQKILNSNTIAEHRKINQGLQSVASDDVYLHSIFQIAQFVGQVENAEVRKLKYVNGSMETELRK